MLTKETVEPERWYETARRCTEACGHDIVFDMIVNSILIAVLVALAIATL